MVRKRTPTLHPACKLFPLLGENELQELADDIMENGLQNAIVLLDGKVLDGQNRLAACKLAGVKPRFVEWKGSGSPLHWIVSQNLMRRHLSASQRAAVALDLLPMLEVEAKGRQRKSKGRGKKVAQDFADFSENGKASEIAARVVGASSRYVEMVKEISQTQPELIDRIRSGELSVPEARKLASVPSKNGKRKRNNPSPDDESRILHGDCLDLIPQIADNSVQLVLTSPPYAEQRKGHYKGVSESKFPEWVVRWMEPIGDKLTDDGSVLIVIRPHLKNGVLSDYVLQTRLALREDGWFENEELIWLKPDAAPLGSTKRPRRAWESVLWFSKTSQPYCNTFACGRDSNRIGFDASVRFGIGKGVPVHSGQNYEIGNGKARCNDVFVAPVGGNPAWNDHPAVFPESLAEQLIMTFSREGDLVVDPFVGSGTTCASAKKLRRDFRGFDISKKYVKLALKRLSDV